MTTDASDNYHSENGSIESIVKNVGHLFKFSCFIQFLQQCNNKILKENIAQTLQKMEYSAGLKSFCAENVVKISFFKAINSYDKCFSDHLEKKRLATQRKDNFKLQRLTHVTDEEIRPRASNPRLTRSAQKSFGSERSFKSNIFSRQKSTRRVTNSDRDDVHSSHRHSERHSRPSSAKMTK